MSDKKHTAGGSVLVIGGGISGIQAALDLANAGVHVIMVEKGPTIGGKMAVLDKNFPTLDCSICIEAPKMSEVGQHKNIELLTLSEVEKLEGGPGEFKATIRSKARFVTDECTRCADCVAACPSVAPNEHEAGMAFRKAIYTPLPQSVPGAYLIDPELCLNDPPNYLACHRCVEACKPKCIKFDMSLETTNVREVAAVIVAAGYDMIRPELVREFGYGTHPDILTSLELERLLSSAGPTGGEITRPSDGKHPHKALLVLCAGSRDVRHVPSCSRFCCMYSVKHAFQLKDHGIEDVTVLYMDRRAYGKGFDEFWDRTRDLGVKFVRGRPASVGPSRSRAPEASSGDPEGTPPSVAGTNGSVKVKYEDTHATKIVTEDFDMVVLAPAVIPPAGLKDLAQALEFKLSADGFVATEEARGALLSTSRPGVYVSGCAAGPKDIPDSVAEGSAAAALAMGHAHERAWPEPEMAEPIPGIEEARVGVFICHCGSNIAGTVDVHKTADFARTLPGVKHSQTQMFSCAGTTQKEIENVIREKQLSRVVVAACSPKTHEGIFKDVCRRAGLNPYLLEMVNLRNQDSWVHKTDKDAATEKALDMVRMGVEKARRLSPLTEFTQPVERSALVIGGGVAGMTAAAALARQGYPTHLVERSPKLGGILLSLDELAPGGVKAAAMLDGLQQELQAAGARVHLNATVAQVGGHVGNFTARLSTGEELKIGAIVLAMGAVPITAPPLNGASATVTTNLELEKRFAAGELPGKEVTFIGCVGSREGEKGCSRYCCASMIGQALKLARAGKKVRVLVRDVRTFSRDAEELYAAASKEGVRFHRLPPDEPWHKTVKLEAGAVTFHDALLDRDVRLPTDLAVLALALAPAQEEVSAQLKVAHSRDGFLLEVHPKLGPAETASAGIYLAGAVQAPKDVRDSVATALAASGKAAALLAKGKIDKEPLTARLDLAKCTGCMACVGVCPFHAIEQLGKVREGRVRILDAVCMACGTCAAQCNFGAIEMPFFTKDQVLAQVDAALVEHPEEKVLVFACNWCSYAGADQAGIEKIQYPPSSRVIRTMCSARVEQSFVNRAFDKGAGAVLLTGCHLSDKGSDCHYNYANQNTAKRFRLWQASLGRKGIKPDRFQLTWISAAEGKEFAAKMREMDRVVQSYSAPLTAPMGG